MALKHQHTASGQTQLESPQIVLLVSLGVLLPFLSHPTLHAVACCQSLPHPLLNPSFTPYPSLLRSAPLPNLSQEKYSISSDSETHDPHTCTNYCSYFYVGLLLIFITERNEVGKDL